MLLVCRSAQIRSMDGFACVALEHGRCSAHICPLGRMNLGRHCEHAAINAVSHGWRRQWFSVGGNLGRSDLTIDEIDTDDFEIDDAYKIMVGFNLGIIPLIDLAVEASYRDFGGVSRQIVSPLRRWRPDH